MAATLNVYIVTFNCGGTPVDYDYFATHLFRPYEDHAAARQPDLIVLSLQEIAPIAYSFLGGSFLAYYFARFIEAIRRATGSSGQYRHIVTHNAGMTGILVFARSDITAHFRWIQSGDVGVGILAMGNKGAAAIRLGYAADEHTEPVPLTFVSAHLAPMEDAVERRNSDWENIVRKLGFRQPNIHSTQDNGAPKAGEDEPLLGTQQALFTDNSPIFFAGDLNYRTSDKSPGPQDYKKFPQPSVSQDDARHFSNFLNRDQLRREQQAGKTLHFLDEGKIDFPPTYKFADEQQAQVSKGVMVDDDKPEAWIWSKHRYPSWCDRILFSYFLTSSKMFKILAYAALPLQPTSDHRPVALAFQLDLTALKQADTTQETPFAQDRNWEAQRTQARRLEIGVGIASYLAQTWEGNGLILATVVGAIGGWLVMQSLVGT